MKSKKSAHSQKPESILGGIQINPKTTVQKNYPCIQMGRGAYVSGQQRPRPGHGPAPSAGGTPRGCGSGGGGGGAGQPWPGMGAEPTDNNSTRAEKCSGDRQGQTISGSQRFWFTEVGSYTRASHQGQTNKHTSKIMSQQEKSGENPSFCCF